MYHNEVKKEVNSVNYFSITANDTSDICQFQLVLILCYIVDGKSVERSWKFLNTEGHDANAISKRILTEPELLIAKDPHKLTAQIYDDASAMSRSLNGVEKLITQVYKKKISCFFHFSTWIYII